VLNYPLALSFKLIAIAPQVKVVDAAGATVMYVRQKVLALREDVKVYSDDSQQNQIYQINADRIIDWSANYRIKRMDGETVGTVRRKGLRSLWSATYPIADDQGTEVGLIHEESAMVKVLDALVGEVPIVGPILTMFINPKYLVEVNGRQVAKLIKKPAFFEGKFIIEREAEMTEKEEALVLPSILMMLMLERNRG
jgi:uncharacterized protein YxjI